MDAVLDKSRHGAPHWPADIALRVAGLGMLLGFQLCRRWECDLAAQAPHLQATPLEFLAATLAVGCLGAGIALTSEGGALFRDVSQPPRGVLP